MGSTAGITVMEPILSVWYGDRAGLRMASLPLELSGLWQQYLEIGGEQQQL